MSLLKNSKHTLSANLINQISSMMIFLTIPNMLSQGDYAQTIFISVLLSFLVLSDFGMSFVYGRKMPSIYHDGDVNQIEIHNQTFFWFRLIMSFVGSVIISSIYFFKYESILNTLLLLFLNPLTILITFFIAQYSVKEDFKVYKNINIKNAVARVLIIPFSYFLGVSGWILAQLFASILVLKSIKENIFFETKDFDLKLIRAYFFEGLSLLAVFFFWNQLLNSGRLFASFSFDDSLIAQYGLTNAAYSLLLTLSISIFLPVTVATLKIVQTETKSAIEQLFRVIVKTSLLISFVVILSIEISPCLFEVFFPKYTIDFVILKYQLLSLMALPFVATLGNVFIGLRQPIKLIFINAISFGTTYMVFISMKSVGVSAAIAQCIGVNFLGILLLVSVVYFYGEFINNKYIKMLQLLAVVFLPYILYFLIRSFI